MDMDAGVRSRASQTIPSYNQNAQTLKHICLYGRIELNFEYHDRRKKILELN